MLKNVLGQQASVFGKGNEQDAVKHGLRGGDAVERVDVGRCIAYPVDQGRAQRLVVGIERIGDVFVFAAAFLEQVSGFAAEQVFRAE